MENIEKVKQFKATIENIKNEIRKDIVGQDDVVDNGDWLCYTEIAGRADSLHPPPTVPTPCPLLTMPTVSVQVRQSMG